MIPVSRWLGICSPHPSTRRHGSCPWHQSPGDVAPSVRLPGLRGYINQSLRVLRKDVDEWLDLCPSCLTCVLLMYTWKNMYLWFHRCMLYIFRFTNVCIHNTYIYIYVYLYIFYSFIPFNFFFYRLSCRQNPWRRGPEIFHCGFTQLFRITIWRHGPQHKLCFLGEILPKSPSSRFVNDSVFCCLPIYLFSQILVYLTPFFTWKYDQQPASV